MPIHVGDAGVFKEPTQTFVGDAGVWKEVQETFVGDAGVWKKTFSASNPLAWSYIQGSATFESKGTYRSWGYSDGSIAVASNTSGALGTITTPVKQGNWSSYGAELNASYGTSQSTSRLLTVVDSKPRADILPETRWEDFEVVSFTIVRDDTQEVILDLATYAQTNPAYYTQGPGINNENGPQRHRVWGTNTWLASSAPLVAGNFIIELLGQDLPSRSSPNNTVIFQIVSTGISIPNNTPYTVSVEINDAYEV